MQAMQLLQIQEQSEPETKNQNMFHLWWVNRNNDKRFCAGRAFYNEKNGDFSLLINLLESSSKEPKRDELYLRAIQASEDQVYFRLEKVIHRPNRTLRFCVGEGFQNKTTGGDIHINIEPLTGFNKKLVLSLNPKKDGSHE